MNLSWSPEAAADFAGLVSYIHEDNPSAAEQVAQAISERIASLVSFPKLGRSGRIRGTRELVLSPLPFIAVYRVTDEAVEIVRLLHGSQPWP